MSARTRERATLDALSALANIEEGIEHSRPQWLSNTRRPWLLFSLISLSAVVIFAAGGPVYAAMSQPVRRVLATPTAGRVHQLTFTRHFAVPPPPPGTVASSPPPPPAAAAATTTEAPKPKPTSKPAEHSLVSQRAVDSKGAVDPGGAARVAESSPLIQGIIEAGFSRAQAVAALTAVGAKTAADIPRAIEWSLKQNVERNVAEAKGARQAHTFDKMDFDGYALMWGDKHRTRTLEECGAKCAAWKPIPPSNFACNVFVFCPLEKCYAPAALPPGTMTGQCWLKHQEDPNNPQVNMRGDYSDAYRKRHPGSPPSVQWQVGMRMPLSTLI